MESTSGGHVGVELVGVLHGQPGAAQRREGTGEDDVAIAQSDHIDTHGLGRPRVLTRRPRPQAPARSEQHDLQDDHDHDRGQADRPWLSTALISQPTSGRSAAPFELVLRELAGPTGDWLAIRL